MSMMDSIRNVLRNTMKNLTAEHFKNFKLHLKDTGKISWCDLENSDRYGITEQIVQVYTVKECGKVVLAILKEMNLNQMALDLENELNTCHCLSSRNNGTLLNQEYPSIRFNGAPTQSFQTDTGTPVKRMRLINDYGYIKSLSEAEKEKINSLRVGTVWKSEQMKKMPSDNIFLINEKIAALEAELEAGTNQQEKHKAHLGIFKEALRLHKRIQVTFGKAADRIEWLQTEKEIIEEFDRLRQFLQDEEEAWIAARREEEEQKHRKMKEMMERMSREMSSFPATL